MPEGVPWTTGLQWAVWSLVMILVMGWIGRSRFRARSTAETRTLRHPPSTLILGLACFGFFAGIAVVSNVYRNSTTTWWTTSIFVGFALLSALMLLDYVRAKHEVSDEGLAYRSLFIGTRKYLRWSELRAVRYAPVMKWFRLETRSGGVARISVMLMGLPEFARLLLEHAPRGAIESGTRPVLQATAEGQPPSVWN
jgi:hypothetical protein